MNKWGLSMLEISKIIMYAFCYDYEEQKNRENTKSCYMDTGNFIVYIKPKDIYEDIAKDVEITVDTSNDETERALPQEEESNWINERWIRRESNNRV